MRSAAATLRGAYLRAWRYGPGFDRLVEQALAREQWSADEWHAWTEQRLGTILHRAATRVPFYRAQWARRRQSGDRASWEVLENWPLLEKETVRRNSLAFIADDREPTRMYHEHTSGTTGKAIDLWFSRETVREWYALHEARSRRWHGVSRHDRWAILGGQLVTPVTQQRPPFWVWNAALKQLYLSAYHLAPQFANAYAGALRDHRVRYMIGYPSGLYAIARELVRQGVPGPRLTVVVSNAEPLGDIQRRTIEAAFSCPVRDTYGMSEAVAAASECPHGGMHIWPDVGVLQVLDRHGSRVPEQTTGEFVCTGLLNADMPLIRYRVGDRGSLASPEASCACGRSLPQLAFVEGRTDDLLYAPDGRVVGRMDPVFKARLPIREAQIIQEAIDVIRVRYIPADGFTEADGESIAERIRARMGRVTVVLEAVDDIPRTSNGKFRAVICNLSPDDRRAITGTAGSTDASETP